MKQQWRKLSNMAIKYGEEDIAEAIDIYKTLGNETFYGPEEEDPADQQEQPKQ